MKPDPITTVGTRLTNKPDGFLNSADLAIPAVYGRVISKRFHGTPACWWHVVCPDGSGCSLNPQVHIVTEHDDGSITVLPSSAARHAACVARQESSHD